MMGTGGENSTDEFVFIEDHDRMPIRSKSSSAQKDLGLDLHLRPTNEGILVSIVPPLEPESSLEHVACDIVLVIDVSGSMSSSAPLPDVQDRNQSESSGLSILDLTKHAARTVLETLNERDRLGLVTFSYDAKVVQTLQPMTAASKKEVWEKIESLQVEGATNLWSGLRSGIKLFEDTTAIGNTQAMYVLTDGMPNHMSPEVGFVGKLMPMYEKVKTANRHLPQIHTFGFGYHIKSGLLQSIAEVTQGAYAFIPDASMIGTVFVHACANLFATFASSASIEVSTRLNLELSGLPGSKIVDQWTTTVPLGSLQYGQTRDIWFDYASFGEGDLDVKLSCRLPNGHMNTTNVRKRSTDYTCSDPGMLEYHRFRQLSCAFLVSLFPIRNRGEHIAIDTDQLEDALMRLGKLSAAIKSSTYAEQPDIKSLLEDLVGDEPVGQVSKALLETNSEKYWTKWGRHYLPSLLHAHQRQTCNSFKDPGPLRYGIHSPLFLKCRAQLDDAFDNLPSPKPSRPSPHANGDAVRVNMGRYNRSSNPCFHGDALIRLGNESKIPVSEWKREEA